MVRFAFAGLAVLALVDAATAAEDNGPTLVDLFAKTCALRPALPSEMERIGSALGFVSRGSAITAEMESGPSIDILYSARFTQRGENIGLTAYFDGPADGPTVTCSLSVTGVSAEVLPGLIETSLDARNRTEKPAVDDNRLLLSWSVGTAEDGDALEISARRDASRRASIALKYRGRQR